MSSEKAKRRNFSVVFSYYLDIYCDEIAVTNKKGEINAKSRPFSFLNATFIHDIHICVNKRSWTKPIRFMAAFLIFSDPITLF